ncbi:MAG TPA: ATP synthase F1 subunit delta [Methylomirabilota bacterium]|nr:ATP synthase F1 subunit delta [Methylomirabilota bacterium]
MKSTRAARSYAKALHDLARAAGRADDVARELASVVEVVRGDAALEEFFARPGVSAAAKRGVGDEIAQRLGVSKLVRDFVGLVAGHGRATLLPEMGDAYGALVDADANRARARVRSAIALNDQERAALASRLGAALGGTRESARPQGGGVDVVLEEVVDKELLGGFVAEVGSLVMDGSLDGQLARLRERLAKG